ncbi:MAG TPA: deoxyhypusine synthase family protein [candidate division Zixibacteria bacterium]|nr:deoxyhypusine synthase family protein [candidate division Zixibacteria bacterium]
MQRKEILREPVKHVKISGTLTVDQLIKQFKNSGSFEAGRLAAACDIYERMLRDQKCTVFLGLAGAVVPAGMRTLIADMIRENLIDVVVTTGANMVHDTVEALGGHHYKGHWNVDDHLLYRNHTYRIYDVFVPEEDFIRLDMKLVEMYDEIAAEYKGKSLSSRDFAWEVGKRLTDSNSILRAAYEARAPIFIPAVRDSEFGYIYYLHASRKHFNDTLVVDAFKDVPEIIGICKKSPRNGMIIIGGGVPRNTIQSAALATKSGIDYAVVITMDRPETGGLSGSTLEETVSWGKLKGEADKTMVIGEAMMVFPMMVASVIERVGEGFRRTPRSKNEMFKSGGSK